MRDVTCTHRQRAGAACGDASSAPRRTDVDLATDALGKNHAMVRVYERLPRARDGGEVDCRAEAWWRSRVRQAVRQRREGILLYADYALRRACGERTTAADPATGGDAGQRCFFRQLDDARAALSSCSRVVPPGSSGCERCKTLAASQTANGPRKADVEAAASPAGTSGALHGVEVEGGTKGVAVGEVPVVACNSTQRAAELLLTAGRGAAFEYVEKALQREQACLDSCMSQVQGSLKELGSAPEHCFEKCETLLGAWLRYDDSRETDVTAPRTSRCCSTTELAELSNAAAMVASDIAQPLVRADCVEDQRRSLRQMRDYLARRQQASPTAAAALPAPHGVVASHTVGKQATRSWPQVISSP